jgi:hypothetical protein
MTRIIRRLPVSVKLVAFLLVALWLTSASGDATSKTTAIVLVAGALWWVASRRKSSQRRAHIRRGKATSRSRPGLAGMIWRRLKPSVSGPPRAASPHAFNRVGLAEVMALTPGQFEEFTVGVLDRLGYTELRRTGGSGDLGVDIAGRDPLGRTAIVQCKRYAPTRKIGSPMVQTFIGMMAVHHQADHGLIVSTSRFTADAINLAHHHGIVLIDGESLTKLLRQDDRAIRRQVEQSWWRI